MWSPFDSNSDCSNRLLLELSPPEDSSINNKGPKGPCAVCGTLSKTHCSGCDDVFYCSKKHQSTDWKKHKQLCRSFMLPTQHPLGVNKGKDHTLSSADYQSRPRWMTASRDLPSGSIIFTEKPLIVTPNPMGNAYPICLACCRRVTPSDQGKSASSTSCLHPCTRCLLPICPRCTDGHASLECAAISIGASKNRALMLSRTSSFLMDISILKVLILNGQPSKWTSFLALRANPRYPANQKDPTDGVKLWLESDYPLSEAYFKSINLGSSLKLEDIILLYAIFSDTSPHSSDLRVLYEFRSWIGHACSPNAEMHFHPSDPNLTIYLKSVESVKSDSLISVNFMQTDYADGLSKSAIRLWNAARLVCGEKACSCRYPGRVDGSVGVRCGQIRSSSMDFGKNCSGFLAPLMDPPNPDKPHLGILIYNKSKIWNCSKCRRTEKFGGIMRQVRETEEMMKCLVDKYCAAPTRPTYLDLVKQVHLHVGDQHWLWCRVNSATLSCMNEITSSGRDMLSKLIRLPPSSPVRSELLSILTIKRDLYGDGVYPSLPKAFQSQPTEKGLLSLLSLRHGRLSALRGGPLLDALFTNIILFGEEFRVKMAEMIAGSSLPSFHGIESLASEVLSKWKLFLKLGQEAAGALQNPTFPTPESRIFSEFALELVALIQSAVAQGSCKSGGSSSTQSGYILSTMARFMTRFCIADPIFCARLVSFLQEQTPSKQPDYLSTLFDPGYSTSSHCGRLTFGPAYGSGNGDVPTAENEWDEPPEKLPEWKGDATNFLDSDEISLGSSLAENLSDLDLSNDEDDDIFSTTTLEYYQQLLNATIRQRRATEDLLSQLFDSRRN